MALWGTLDNATGNNKPLYSNTSSTYGVSATEAANTSGDGSKITHAGWVKQTIGTGYIQSITITSGGAGYNAAGYLVISGGGGSNANIAFTIANSQNTLQSFSSNAYWNVVATATIVNKGDGFTSTPTVTVAGSNISPATIAVTMGGRIGRRFYETLVAGGAITGDDAADDTYFPGT